MSKRKRATPARPAGGSEQPPPAEDTKDTDSSAPGEMAHVSPDLLAGSPDIFASRPSEREASSEPEPAAGEISDAASRPIEPVEPVEPEAAIESPLEPTDASTTLGEPEAPAPASLPPPAAPPPPAAAVTAARYPAVPARRTGSSMALGIVLVVVGLFALGVVMFGVDLTQYGWPLFVIIPGLTLLVIGFVGLGAGASIPGGMITMLGLVLAYQSSTGDWPSWAFAWALIVPGGLGLGMYLQALKDRDPAALRRGRALMFVGGMIFLIGFVLFESILGISNMDYGGFGKAALPLLLIVIGIVLLVRSAQNRRRV
jgi:hypothetical protein